MDPQADHQGSGDATSRFLVELSHPIEQGMVTYPGLPEPVVRDHLSRDDAAGHYAPGVEFSIQSITMVGNTGTYLDSPYHRYAAGGDLASLPLAALADLPAVVIHRPNGADRAIGIDELATTEVAGRAVLLHTGWDEHWRTAAYGRSAPYLRADAASWLVERGAILVGIDSINIDDTEDLRRPAHSILLAADIPIVEHLTGLEQLPKTGARFTAAPPRVQGFGTFPVRAYASVTLADV